MNTLRRTALLTQFGRRLASSDKGAVSPKLKMMQEKMQVHDGKPVHLKGGPIDSILYYTTMGLSVFGVGCCFKLYYDLSVPKK